MLEVLRWKWSALPAHSPLSMYVLHMWPLCSFSLFCSILGFDTTPSYQGLLVAHPFCSYQRPSLSQSFTLTCTALYPILSWGGDPCSVGGRWASGSRVLDSKAVKCVPTSHQTVTEKSHLSFLFSDEGALFFAQSLMLHS